MMKGRQKNGETCLRCEQNPEYQQSLLHPHYFVGTFSAPDRCTIPFCISQASWLAKECQALSISYCPVKQKNKEDLVIDHQ